MHTNRIEHFEHVIKENPKDTFALFALSKEYEKNKQFNEAIQYLEKLLLIDDKYIGTYYHLAKLYEQINDVKKALNIYDSGILLAQDLNDFHSLSELKNAKMNLELDL
ncbi:MAG: tetratricopeptide repeat protein [Chitinophagales bacterium]